MWYARQDREESPPACRARRAAAALHSFRARLRSTTTTTRAYPEALLQLVEDGVIDSIVLRLKSGKEADLFVVEREPYHYVAKVYKERKFRSFKNDAGYREGRRVRNTRTQRALDKKGSRFGQEQAEKAWHTAEADALYRLDGSGASVPRVLAHHDRVLIMEMICDEHGQPAPQLAQVPLSPEGALEMYDQVLEQVILLLLNDLVHGDLSPYNILVRGGKPVIIDMPQVVSASQNQQAERMLERDVNAVARHLGLIEPSIRKLGKAAWQLWAEYEGGSLTPEFRPSLERKRENEIADLDSLVDFVKEAAEEAVLEQRAAEGDKDAAALLKAAQRRKAKQERRMAEAKALAEAEAAAKVEEERRKQRAAEKAARRASGQRDRDRRQRGDDKAGDQDDSKAGGKKRRRRRGRGGRRDDNANASANDAAATASPDPKEQEASQQPEKAAAGDGPSVPSMGRRRRRNRGGRGGRGGGGPKDGQRSEKRPERNERGRERNEKRPERSAERPRGGQDGGRDGERRPRRRRRRQGSRGGSGAERSQGSNSPRPSGGA